MLKILMDYVEKGGFINGLIFIACFIIMYMGLGKFFLFRSIERGGANLKAFSDGLNAHVNRYKKKQLTALDEFIGRCRPGGPPVAGAVNLFREVLLACVPELESGLDTMAAWINIAPLLGLLGTVVGMIQTFTIIMQYGVGNPGLLSEGISVALLTTEAGLLVAFPGLLFHSHLWARKEVLVKRLILEGEKTIGIGKERAG